MAKTKQPTSALTAGILVECVISINPRGRSVITGTLASNVGIRTFKHDLSDSEKSDIEEFIFKALGQTLTREGE